MATGGRRRKAGKVGRLGTFWFGLAGGLIGGLVAAAVVVLVGEHPRVKLGNVAEWVAGIATAGALIYTGWALRVEIKARQDADRRFAFSQALLVELKFWPAPARMAPAILYPLERKVDCRIGLHNQGQSILFDVSVRAYIGTTEVHSWPVGTVPAGGRFNEALSKQWGDGDFPDGHVSVAASFTDSSGRRWLRKAPQETLEEVVP